MTTRTKAVMILIALVSPLANSCVSSISSPTPSAPPTHTPPTLALTNTPEPATEQAVVYDGVWQSDDYNWILDIQGNHGTAYEITQMSCVLALSSALRSEGAATFFEDMKLTLAGDQLAVLLVDGPLYTPLSKITALPELCSNGGIADTQDPVANFEIFWHTFQENYPFFGVRGMDWQKQYDTFRPQVEADMDQSALFELLSKMIAPLNDAHVWLYDPARSRWVGSTKENPKWAYNATQQENIIVDYLGGYGKIKPVGALWYGKLNSTIGYLNVKAEAGYASASMDDRAGAAAAIDQAIRDLSDVKAMIVDTRFNGGGLDTVSLALASRFADQRRLAFSYQSSSEESSPLAYEAYLDPGGERQFTKPVFLLTSSFTVSSGETFVLAMRALPNVTIIGERTRGCFSLETRNLPNGMFFGLSSSSVIASDGTVYEGVGIPPDIEIAAYPPDYPYVTDDILDKAIELASAIE